MASAKRIKTWNYSSDILSCPDLVLSWIETNEADEARIVAHGNNWPLRLRLAQATLGSPFSGKSKARNRNQCITMFLIDNFTYHSINWNSVKQK